MIGTKIKAKILCIWTFIMIMLFCMYAEFKIVNISRYITATPHKRSTDNQNTGVQDHTRNSELDSTRYKNHLNIINKNHSMSLLAPHYPLLEHESQKTKLDQESIKQYHEINHPGHDHPSGREHYQLDHGASNNMKYKEEYLMRPNETIDRHLMVSQPKQIKEVYWGSHTLGRSLESFILKEPTYGMKWVTYFHDQSIALILQKQDRTIINCTVLEVIPMIDQVLILRRLGRVMPLERLGLHEMIYLITICGTLELPGTNYHYVEEPSVDTPSLSSAFNGILPGTLWCGSGDIADRYEDLGSNIQLDRCCRDHDHCPVKIKSFAMRYGVYNYDIATRSHCACELEFFRCLKFARSHLADAIGHLYFNIWKAKCLEEVQHKPIQQQYQQLQHSPSSSKQNDKTNQYIINSPSSSYNYKHPRQLNSPYPPTYHNVPSSEPQLNCIKVDKEGQCIMWHHNTNDIRKFTFSQIKLVY